MQGGAASAPFFCLGGRENGRYSGFRAECAFSDRSSDPDGTMLPGILTVSP